MTCRLVALHDMAFHFCAYDVVDETINERSNARWSFTNDLLNVRTERSLSAQALNEIFVRKIYRGPSWRVTEVAMRTPRQPRLTGCARWPMSIMYLSKPRVLIDTMH